MLSDSEGEAERGGAQDGAAAQGAAAVASGEESAPAGPPPKPRPACVARFRPSRTQRMLIGLSKQHAGKRPREGAPESAATVVTAASGGARAADNQSVGGGDNAGAVSAASAGARKGSEAAVGDVHVAGVAVRRDPDVSWIGRRGDSGGHGCNADRGRGASQPSIRRSAAALSKDVLSAFDEDPHVAGASQGGASATLRPSATVVGSAEQCDAAASRGAGRGGSGGLGHATAPGRGRVSKRRKPVIKLGPMPPVEGAVGARGSEHPPRVAVAGTTGDGPPARAPLARVTHAVNTAAAAPPAPGCDSALTSEDPALVIDVEASAPGPRSPSDVVHPTPLATGAGPAAAPHRVAGAAAVPTPAADHATAAGAPTAAPSDLLPGLRAADHARPRWSDRQMAAILLDESDDGAPEAGPTAHRAQVLFDTESEDEGGRACGPSPVAAPTLHDALPQVEVQGTSPIVSDVADACEVNVDDLNVEGPDFDELEAEAEMEGAVNELGDMLADPTTFNRCDPPPNRRIQLRRIVDPLCGALLTPCLHAMVPSLADTEPTSRVSSFRRAYGDACRFSNPCCACKGVSLQQQRVDHGSMASG